jgi:periplasmic protein TonB
LPIQSQTITDVFFSESVPSGPEPKGVPKPTSQDQPTSNNSKPVEITQNNLIPEDGSFVESSKPFTDLNNFSDLPVGDPNGVDGALPGDKGTGGSGTGGNGITGNGPVDEKEFGTLGVEQPILVHRIEPSYPRLALIAHIEGTVVLRALISRNGDIQNITLLRSAHPFLNQSAIEAVSQWKYKPATLRGKPIAVYFTVTVAFKIK